MELKGKLNPLMELCSLIITNPTQFTPYITRLVSRCPTPEAFSSTPSPRVTRSHLDHILATTHLLSKLPSLSSSLRSPSLLFLRHVTLSFSPSFWPQSSSPSSVHSFLHSYLSSLSLASGSDPDLSSEIASIIGHSNNLIIRHAIDTVYNNNYKDDTCIDDVDKNDDKNDGMREYDIARMFLLELSENLPAITAPDAESLIAALLERIPDAMPLSPRDAATQSGASSFQSSPASITYFQPASPGSSSGGNSRAVVGGEDSAASSMNGVAWKSGGVEHVGESGGGVVVVRQQVASFEEESVESLERQEIVFKLLGQILDRVRVDPQVLEQVRLVAKRQLQSSSAFLKV